MSEKRNCYCGVEFVLTVKNKIYCSKKCGQKIKDKTHAAKRKTLGLKRNLTIVNKNCEQCGTHFKYGRTKSKRFCSVKCVGESKRKYLNIPKCLAEADRKLDKNLGYVRIYVPMHPRANTRGYVYEHIVIAEQSIDRSLLKNEIVHHKNGVRWDNRPQNLEVMDKMEHAELGGQREEDIKDLEYIHPFNENERPEWYSIKVEVSNNISGFRNFNPDLILKEVEESSLTAVGKKYNVSIGIVSSFIKKNFPDRKKIPKVRISQKSFERKSKIDWPSDKDLLDSLKIMNMVKLGKMLGVSNTAIKKRLKKKNLI